jgi:hypothetical protein
MKVTTEVIRGVVVTEVHQHYSDWLTHVIRLYADQPYVEIEWTAGPIPINTPWFPPVAFGPKPPSPFGPIVPAPPLPNQWGKEVVVRYSSGLASKGIFHTDSNGKEMVKVRRTNATAAN